MKHIKVLGTGCASCKTTTDMIKKIADRLGVPIKLQKVEDIQSIVSYGIMSTPGVVIDHVVVHAGGIPSQVDVEQWLRNG